MAAAALTAVAGGANTISSLGTAGLQWAAGKDMQTSQQNYNTDIMNKAIGSFKQSGLPSYMAFQSNSSSNMPAMKFSMGGGNFWTGGPVNSSLPILSTPYQSYEHKGTPSRYARVAPPELQQNNELRNTNLGINFVGQNDRLGLGYGRYSLRPPGPGPILGNALSASRPQSQDIAFRRALN